MANFGNATELSIADILQKKLHIFYPNHCNFKDDFKVTDNVLETFDLGNGHILHSVYCGQQFSTPTINQGSTRGSPGLDIYYWVYQRSNYLDQRGQKDIFLPLFFQYPLLSNVPYENPKLEQIKEWKIEPEFKILSPDSFKFSTKSKTLESHSCLTEDCHTVIYYQWKFFEYIGFYLSDFNVSYEEKVLNLKTSLN